MLVCFYCNITISFSVGKIMFWRLKLCAPFPLYINVKGLDLYIAIFTLPLAIAMKLNWWKISRHSSTYRKISFHWNFKFNLLRNSINATVSNRITNKCMLICHHQTQITNFYEETLICMNKIKLKSTKKFENVLQLSWYKVHVIRIQYGVINLMHTIYSRSLYLLLIRIFKML